MIHKKFKFYSIIYLFIQIILFYYFEIYICF
jgi:hypothetical protein